MKLTRFGACALSTLLIAALPSLVLAQQASEKSPAQSRPGMKPSETPPTQKQQPFAEAAPAQKLTTTPSSQLQGFNVVLLLGDMQAGEGQDTVPVAARKALNDMKDFLPYKSYRLLDTQWVLCCPGSGPSLTRLRGVDDQEYELEVRGIVVDSAGAVSVRFVLRDPAPVSVPFKQDSDRTPMHPKELSKSDGEPTEISREIFQLDRERVDLTTQLTTLRQKVDIGMADPEQVKRMDAQLGMINRRLGELRQSLQAVQASPAKSAVGRVVIDTGFRMDQGETVVVGSSGVKGGKRALIALLTAVPAGHSTKK